MGPLLLLVVFLLLPLWCEVREVLRKISPELPRQKIRISRLSNPTRIHVRTKPDEVAIPIAKREKTDDFIVGLWYVFSTPDLMWIVLSYLDPELLTWCVEPNTFISRAFTKQYKKELYRIAHVKNVIQTNQFFSCENMMLLAMTNSVFNEAYREAQEVQELGNADFELFKDYAQSVYSAYNIWIELYSSVDVHKQMKLFFPKFRGIPHENRLLKIARNNIRFYRTISAIETITENFKKNRRHIIYSLVWTAVSIVYAEIYVRYLYDTTAWIFFAMVLTLSWTVSIIIALISLPSVYLMCVAAFKTRKLLNKSEFVKIGDTISEQEKHVKSLLFLDNL